MTAIKEYDAFEPDDTRGNFFHFFHKCHAKSHACLRALQRVVLIDCNMDDGNFFLRRTQKHDHTHGRGMFAVAVEGIKSLRFGIADANREARSSLFNPGMAELLERMENAIPNQVLPGIQ